MSEIITRTVVELEQLGLYHELNKAYIDAGLAKKWESATFDSETGVVSFYTVPQPSGDVEPAFTFTLPEVDFTEVNNKISAIEAKIGTVEDGDTVVGMIAKNAEAIESHKTSIDSVVTTLVGDDANKSVRTIANEELAAQLLSGEAEADFKTLQELATWLENHPEDVATINLNITNLQKLVGTLPEDATSADVVGYIAEVVATEKTRAEGVEGGLDTRLKAVEEAVGEGGSVDTQIDAKIAELDADVTSATVEEGKGIQVQVVEVGGKVTTVAVTGNYDNSYDAKGSANTALESAKSYADGKDEAIADAKKAGTDAATAVTALTNGAVATNATNIATLQEKVDAIKFATEDEIRGLFA